MSAPTIPVATTPCPRCQAPASGKFCASCGAPLEGARCAGCASYLTPGARFCHRCGLAAGAPGAGPGTAVPGTGAARGAAAGRSTVDAVPWAVAAIALLAIVALVAGQNFRGARGGSLDGSANALPVPGLDDRGASGPMAGIDPNRARTDIANMAPEERALRLYNRVMSLSEQGKRDSVVFFAPMAVTAFQMLDSLTLDQRYDMGRIGEISGIPDLAAAQADTILRQSPTHLLGLILAANAAGMKGQATAQRQFQQRFTAARTSELAKGLPEYSAHQADIQAATAAIGGQ
jgi:hypothetical protein